MYLKPFVNVSSSSVYAFLEPHFLVQLSNFPDLGPRGAQDANLCLVETPLRAGQAVGAPGSGYKD